MKIAFINSKSLGKSWAVHDVLNDSSILKHCVECSSPMIQTTIYEQGKDKNGYLSFYCPKCSKFYE